MHSLWMTDCQVPNSHSHKLKVKLYIHIQIICKVKYSTFRIVIFMSIILVRCKYEFSIWNFNANSFNCLRTNVMVAFRANFNASNSLRFCANKISTFAFWVDDQTPGNFFNAFSNKMCNWKYVKLTLAIATYYTEFYKCFNTILAILNS